MSRFDSGASFAVVAQKDGSFAIVVHEPKRAVPLRITGYASEAEANAAIVAFAAAKPLEPASSPLAPAKPTANIETARQSNAVEDKPDQAAAVAEHQGRAARKNPETKGRRAKTAQKPAARRKSPRR